jgi:hypothetical protein
MTMNWYKRNLIVDVSFFLVFLSVLALGIFVHVRYANAQTTAEESSQVITLKKGEQAPFEGSLLNPIAIAKILAEKEYAKKSCDLDKSFELQKQKVKCDYDISGLKIEIDILNKKYDVITKIKDDEIKNLRDMVLKASNEGVYNKYWFVCGIVIGVATSIGILYAAQGSK